MGGTPSTNTRPRKESDTNTGLVLGGGGWVGVAGETGGLAALCEHAGFTLSAGAYVATMAMGGVVSRTGNAVRPPLCAQARTASPTRSAPPCARL